MRDKRFIAAHRGGPLGKEQHRQLISWACGCVEHILPLTGDKVDERLILAVQVAKRWERGEATVGEARKAAAGAHAAARAADDPVVVAIARAAGHAVATAHMADHSPGAALYGLRAVRLAGKSVEAEREWQNTQLQPEIRELILTAMNAKLKHFRI